MLRRPSFNFIKQDQHGIVFCQSTNEIKTLGRVFQVVGWICSDIFQFSCCCWPER